jgi:hypothetical protein
MEFEKKNDVPDGIKILGWLISLCAFALGFYHTAEGMKYFQPLGFDGGAYVVSALISMLLVVAYSRAVAGVKAALFFYVICALFNFTYNLNSFYPNLNSRKLLQEEAQLISDTIQNNRSISSKINIEASKGDLENLEDEKIQLINEIARSFGFGSAAKDHLEKFNRITKKYNKEPISAGSFQLNNPNNAQIFGELMQKKIDDIRKGQNKFKNVNIASKAFERFEELTRPSEIGSNKLTFIDSTMKEINENKARKNEDLISFQKSVDRLKKIVSVNDETANLINNLKLPDKGKVLKLKVFNVTKDDQLLYPKSNEIGSFAHTLNSMWERINKIDTWGVIILVFFIDFIVPFAIYFMIRKKKNSGENDGMGNSSSRGLFANLFGKKQPEQF